ncbi:K88 fimbrial protein A [Erwinia sp. Ejp617]|nr:type 1 fimbrial protein [Erwinia sp. Ejp617]ADP11027.1 K88 fimbrial protein A [Erwinia sp. Ejp617]
MKKAIKFILLLLAGAGEACAVAPGTMVQRTLFSADVVSSACHVVVEAVGGRGSHLLFDTYRKSIAASVPPRDFIVRLYETGATVQGCSAFMSGQIASLDFGNPGQLDAGGVVTRGAGDGIRVEVRALDAQADFREHLTQENHKVNYPVDFAAKGQLRFRAQPIIPHEVKSGEYSGSLSFVVIYQ